MWITIHSSSVQAAFLGLLAGLMLGIFLSKKITLPPKSAKHITSQKIKDKSNQMTAKRCIDIQCSTLGVLPERHIDLVLHQQPMERDKDSPSCTTVQRQPSMSLMMPTEDKRNNIHKGKALTEAIRQGNAHIQGNIHTPSSSYVQSSSIADEISVLRPLARGSFGQVYLADWRGSKVAVKYISFSNCEEERTRVMREILVHKELTHPHIVQCFHHVIVDNTQSNVTSYQPTISRQSPSVPPLSPTQGIKSPENSTTNHSEEVSHEQPKRGDIGQQTLNSPCHRLRIKTQQQCGVIETPTAARTESLESFDSEDGFGSPLRRSVPLSSEVSNDPQTPQGSICDALVIMEYCDLGSLRKACHRGAYKPGRYPFRLVYRALLRTAGEIARAMQYCHARNIIHGDLKPDNILLRTHKADKRGYIAKLTDFGLSTTVQSTSSSWCCTGDDYGGRSRTNTSTNNATSPTSPLAHQHDAYDGGPHTMKMKNDFDNSSSNNTKQQPGTLAYSAPELLLDGRPTPKTDVYAFGITLWTMYTGTEPYQDMTDTFIWLGIIDGTLRPPIPSSCPQELCNLMRLCWNQDPSRRPGFDYITRSLTTIELHYRSTLPSTPGKNHHREVILGDRDNRKNVGGGGRGGANNDTV